MVTGYLGRTREISLEFHLSLKIFVEKLKIHIPWKHLYSHPTKIELDGLYIVLTSQTGSTEKKKKRFVMLEKYLDMIYDPEQAEEEIYQSKMKEVEKVEKFRREREQYGIKDIVFIRSIEIRFFKEVNRQSPHHKDTFFERLQFHILRNLEIEIRNIHITFDDKSIKSYPFQFGITLKHILLKVCHDFFNRLTISIFYFSKTTNDQWEFMESKEDSKILYKVNQDIPIERIFFLLKSS